MKYKITLVVVFLLLLPVVSFAHGGVSKNVGSVVVYLDQDPISPLVGEKVTLDFSLRDVKNNSLANVPVTLTLTDTYYGDESKDTEVLKQNFTTDSNGDFEFSYTFSKENYFDVDLSLQDPLTKEDDSTGFLVQPRAVPIQNKPLPWIAAALGALIGAAAVYIFTKQKNQPVG